MAVGKKPFVTVYAIARDEAKNVSRWWESAKEADAVVVLDTGSTDGTQEALRALGAAVYEKEITPWRFDEARNQALSLCPKETDLFVSIDLDEAFVLGWAEALKEEWDEEATAYSCGFSTYSGGIFDSKRNVVRIHRPGYKWKHMVHEVLEKEGGEEKIVALSDKASLRHYPDAGKDRSLYFKLLEDREKEEGWDYVCETALACALMGKGNWTEAMERLEAILKEDEGKYADLEEAACHKFLSACHKALGNEREALSHCLSFLRLAPEYRTPYLDLAGLLMDERQWDLAEYFVGKALELKKNPLSWLEDDGAWTYKPFDLLCLVWRSKGDKLKSIAAAAKASKEKPGDERLKRNLEACLGAAGNEDYNK